MHVDWSISFGNLTAVATFLITIVAMHRSNLKSIKDASQAMADASASMARIETKLDTVWTWWVQRDQHR